MAQKAGKIWREYGALEYRECVGEDLKARFGIPFPKLIKSEAGEAVVFSWITYKSKAQRDRINKKVMADPRTGGHDGPGRTCRSIISAWRTAGSRRSCPTSLGRSGPGGLYCVHDLRFSMRRLIHGVLGAALAALLGAAHGHVLPLEQGAGVPAGAIGALVSGSRHATEIRVASERTLKAPPERRRGRGAHRPLPVPVCFRHRWWPAPSAHLSFSSSAAPPRWSRFQVNAATARGRRVPHRSARPSTTT